jgi:hypothetical protein
LKAGSKKGSITIKVDGNDQIAPFTIVRSITEKGESLKIEPEKVLAGETPRSFLDKLIGSISFDPLDFINKDPKRQRSTLMELIGLDVDEWERKEKEVFDERTVKGRELTVAKAKVAGLIRHDDVTDKQEIKVSDLTAKISKSMAYNQELKDRADKNERLKQSGLANKDLIEKLKLQLRDLEATVKLQQQQYRSEKDDLALSFPDDVDAIQQEIQSIESKNSKIRANIQYDSESTNLQSIQTAYDEIDKRLEDIRLDKLKAIHDANIPVPGLLFDDDGLLYNSIPLSQCSDGEKLMIGMGISMALNPTMRVLRIKDGSLLDAKNLKIIQEMVKENGFQLWIESVADLDRYNSTGKVGLYIQEGEIIYDNGVAPTKTKIKKEKDCSAKKENVDEEW